MEFDCRIMEMIIWKSGHFLPRNFLISELWSKLEPFRLRSSESYELRAIKGRIFSLIEHTVFQQQLNILQNMNFAIIITMLLQAASGLTANSPKFNAHLIRTVVNNHKFSSLFRTIHAARMREHFLRQHQRCAAGFANQKTCNELYTTVKLLAQHM